MPYKLSADKKTVLVFRDGHWQILHSHPTEEKAKAHLAALEINVKDKKK